MWSCRYAYAYLRFIRIVIIIIIIFIIRMNNISSSRKGVICAVTKFILKFELKAM